MFAFSGAHRTGKTTLAKAVAERMGLPFVDTNVTAELKAAGFDQVADLDLATRLACQQKRLELHMQKVAAAPRPSIWDRSPLDIAAYTIAEFAMHSDPALATEAKNLVDACLDYTARHYDTVIVVPPLPIYEVEDGKPPMNVGFQHHIHLLMEGLTSEVEHVATAWLWTNVLEDRIAAAAGVIGRRLEIMTEWRLQARVH